AAAEAEPNACSSGIAQEESQLETERRPGPILREWRERARVHDGAEGRLIVGRIAGALLERRELDGAVPLDLEIQERSLTGFAQPVLAIPLNLDFLDHLSHIPGVREVRSIRGERARTHG